MGCARLTISSSARKWPDEVQFEVSILYIHVDMSLDRTIYSEIFHLIFGLEYSFHSKTVRSPLPTEIACLECLP